MPFDAAAARFIRNVSGIPRLSREEERELIARWKQNGDKSAADQVLRANLRYVVQIALRYKFADVPLSDLLSEGCVGLTYALTKFEPERNLRFVTYSANWIKAKVLSHIAHNARQVKIGTDAPGRRMFFALRREHAKALALLGDENAALLAAASAVRVPVERAEFELKRLPDVALDRDVSDDEFSPKSRLASPGPSPEELAIQCEEQHHAGALATSMLRELDSRERVIIVSRYYEDEPLSLAELARRFGLSRERVRQLEARALKKLRARAGVLL